MLQPCLHCIQQISIACALGRRVSLRVGKFQGRVMSTEHGRSRSELIIHVILRLHWLKART